MRHLIAGSVLLIMSITPALAQHDHAAGHDDYKAWASGQTDNCCNNQDCGSLDDADVRDSASGTMIRIEGQWCPVLKQHFIIRGKSPDWSKSHACVQKKWSGCDEGGCAEDARSPCERLLCYGGKGGM